MPGGFASPGKSLNKAMTIAIRFIKSPTAAPYMLAYHIGDEADIEKDVALDLIAQGIAEAVQTPPTQTATKPHERAEKPVSPAAKAEKR